MSMHDEKLITQNQNSKITTATISINILQAASQMG